MSLSTGNDSTTSGFYHAGDGHLCTLKNCTLKNCALRISRKAGKYGRKFLGCSQFNVSNNYIVVFELNWIISCN